MVFILSIIVDISFYLESHLKKGCINGRAEEIDESTNLEEYDKLAEDINGKANSDSEEQRNEAIKHPDKSR
jgi:hypothetical protein